MMLIINTIKEFFKFFYLVFKSPEKIVSYKVYKDRIRKCRKCKNNFTYCIINCKLCYCFMRIKALFKVAECDCW